MKKETEKKTCIKKGMLLVVALFMLFYFLNLTSAVVIGVSPANLTFPGVLRGGYAQTNLVISSDSSDPTNVSVTAIGDISSWLNFTNNLTVSKFNPYTLTFSVNPPKDIPNGNYTGFIIIESMPSGQGIAGHAVGIIRSSLNVYITVRVTDVQVIQCSAAHFDVQTVEQGDDTTFVVEVTNTGNVLLSPQIDIKIWNKDQSQILKTIDSAGSSILPTTKKQVSVTFNTAGLDTSQYWAQVSLPDCLASNLLTFDVLQPGALKADGILLDIFTINKAKVGDTVPIEAHFKNVGEKDVSAQFTGQITKSGKIVQLLNSPLSDIAIGDTGTFNFYFTPQTPGTYIITGKVYYSGKVSYEQSATIDVSSASPLYYILPAFYFVIVILIAFLLIKIIKERKKYKNVLRRLKK